MARDWLKGPKELWQRATLPGQMYYWGQRGVDWAFPEQPEPLPTRPSLGAQGKLAAAQQAKFFQQVLNQQMGQNIGMINREFGAAGRYASGQRGRYIGEEMGRTTQQLGQMVSGTEMDRFRALMSAELAREQMDEEFAWRQARLEAGGAAQQQQTYGQIGQLIALYIMEHPELLAAL